MRQDASSPSYAVLEKRLHRLEAFRAIEDLIVDLGRAFDAGPSAEMLEPLFTEDAVFKIDRYGLLEGGAAIARGVAGNAETGFCWTLHYLVAPKITISPSANAADAEFLLWEPATAASGRAYWIGGRYQARVVKGPAEAWRFFRLELTADLISRYAEGWTEKPEALDRA